MNELKTSHCFGSLPKIKRGPVLPEFDENDQKKKEYEPIREDYREMFKAYKANDIKNTYRSMKMNIEALKSYQEVTRLTYIERDLSSASAAQGANNLTIDATQLRKVTDQLLQIGKRLDKRVTYATSNYHDTKAIVDSQDLKIDTLQAYLLERKKILRLCLADWRRGVFARPKAVADGLKALKQQMRWKANPITKEVDEYFATEPEDADEEALQTWRKLRILDCPIFERFWLSVEGTEFDYSGCQFEDCKING